MRLKLAVPNAYAPEIRALARTQTLPTLDGEETFTLVRDDGGWRVVINWTRSVRLHFHAALQADVPLKVNIVPAEIAIGPGEPVHVTLRARNTEPVR